MPENASVFARRCYQGNVAFIDEWIGKIYNILQQTSQLENTWIIYAVGGCLPPVA
jgi:arylsulfatase A-like enzyme